MPHFRNNNTRCSFVRDKSTDLGSFNLVKKKKKQLLMCTRAYKLCQNYNVGTKGCELLLLQTFELQQRD